MTSYDGQSIAYDTNGNPTSYRGAALTWMRGRMLAGYVKNGTSCGYVYDMDGTRVKKTVNGVVHEYWNIDGRIRRETRGSNLADSWNYYFDADGVCGMNGQNFYEQYYFVKNLQGDVEQIYGGRNTMGLCELYAEYRYDAWGNHKVYDASGLLIYDSQTGVVAGYETHIGNINPFRYRGYYYDVETGLYYLQSRYYDPETGRFVNADSVGYLDPLMLNGLNLYAYCENNPVNMIDSTGHFPILIALILAAGFIIGAGIGGKIAYDNAVSAGKTGSDLFWSTVCGGLLGGGIGLAIAGAVVFSAGMAAGIFGTAGLATPVLGVTALQAFAWGALAWNITAWVIMPLYGITMDGIGFDPDPYVPDKPGETPRHPADKRGKDKYVKIGMGSIERLLNSLRRMVIW